MKKTLYIFLFFVFVGNCFAQEKKDASVKEVLPQYVGGLEALREFISQNLEYPKRAIKKNITGKCYLKFLITETGEVKNVEVLNGVPNCPECDKEAVRVIELMPTWVPGTVNGIPMRVHYNMPISFKVKDIE